MTMKMRLKTGGDSGATEADLSEHNNDLEEVKVAGGSIVDDKPYFSADSR